MIVRKILFIIFTISIFLPLISLEAGEKTATDGANYTITAVKARSALLNINNVSMWASDNGMMERKPLDNTAGVFFPRGSTTIVNVGGLLWAGNVRDGGTQILRVGGQTYSAGTVPGRIVAPGIVENPSNEFVRIYRIRRDWLIADLKRDASEYYNLPLIDVSQTDIENLRAIYKADWIEWPWQKGAPYYERNGIPGYQPDSSGVVDSDRDEPGLASADQVIWFVANDLNASATRALYGSSPIGIEMQVTCWAYNSFEKLKNVIFQRYRLIYKGTANTPPTAYIDSMYLAKWVDPDVGNFSDDFVGCDVDRSLGFGYNSKLVDYEYQKVKLPPAVIGYDLFQGPRVPKIGSRAKWDIKDLDGYENLPMTAFTYFNSSTRTADYSLGNYQGTQQWWNLVRGYSHQPLTPLTCFLNPITKQCTQFELDGDAQRFHGWTDGIVDTAGDRRFAMMTGPFTMAFGDTQEVVIGLIAGMGETNRDGISIVQSLDDAAQDGYNLNFDFPVQVPNPQVRIVELENQIILDWESDTASARIVESYESRGYKFETYTIYQFPLPDSPKEDAIVYEYFDPSQPRYLYITTDKIRNRPLVNGQKYYYAITTTAFNPDPSITEQRIESPIVIHEATPHSPNPGVVYPYSIDEMITDIKNIKGINEATVRVRVYDPAKSDGHIYKVLFHRNTDQWTDFNEKPSWSLIDSTANDTLVNMVRVDSPPKRLITRGFSIETLLPRHGMKGVAQTQYNFQPVYDQVFNTANPGENFMVLGPGSSTLDTIQGYHPSDHDVELRFVGDSSWTLLRDPSGTRASRWLRVPYTAWERRVVGRDTLYRQLFTTILKGNQDSLWRPDYLLNTTYNGKPVKVFSAVVIIIDSLRVGFEYQFTTYYDDLPYRSDVAQYKSYLWLNGQAASPKVTVTRAYIADLDDDGLVAPLGTTIRFERVKEIRNADEKIFSWTAVITDDIAAAKREVDRINVFPNPYYGMNRAEINRYQKFVTFNHLPRIATIRIFNLAGILVRTIRKDDDTQFATWDLNNEYGLSVAGGLYLAHIQLNSKDVNLGEKILKLMIVPEDQSSENN